MNALDRLKAAIATDLATPAVSAFDLAKLDDFDAATVERLLATIETLHASLAVVLDSAIRVNQCGGGDLGDKCVLCGAVFIPGRQSSHAEKCVLADLPTAATAYAQRLKDAEALAVSRFNEVVRLMDRLAAAEARALPKGCVAVCKYCRFEPRDGDKCVSPYITIDPPHCPIRRRSR